MNKKDKSQIIGDLKKLQNKENWEWRDIQGGKTSSRN